MSLILYGYWRSSAAYRVRIALNIKQLVYESRAVHLSREGGEQHHAEFHRLNPSELIPVLIDGELCLNQSLAIIEYLDETYPEPRLIPERGAERYQVKALALDIAADIHPINNLRILQYLTAKLGVADEEKIVGIATGLIKVFKVWKRNCAIRQGNIVWVIACLWSMSV